MRHKHKHKLMLLPHVTPVHTTLSYAHAYAYHAYAYVTPVHTTLSYAYAYAYAYQAYAYVTRKDNNMEKTNQKKKSAKIRTLLFNIALVL